jgi:hypothetical protein
LKLGFCIAFPAPRQRIWQFLESMLRARSTISSQISHRGAVAQVLLAVRRSQVWIPQSALDFWLEQYSQPVHLCSADWLSVPGPGSWVGLKANKARVNAQKPVEQAVSLETPGGGHSP